MPRPVEALPCGSRSTISTCSPIAASAVPRLIAVVVLPTPPFWLASVKTRGAPGGKAFDSISATPARSLREPFLPRAVEPVDPHDAGLGVGLTRVERGFESPEFRRPGQFR